MSQVTLTSKLQFKMYRLGTILKAFKSLYTLPPEKVEAFIDSYSIYDYDWTDEEKLIRELGQEYYSEVKQKLIDWYCVLNNLCAIGQVEKMYIPPAMDLSKSILANQTLYERKMAQDLGVKPGDRGLDIGCGRGRVAGHVASHTGANMTGINIDLTQLESARRFALGTGLSNQCQYLQHDLNDIPFPFPDRSFDFVYHIQVFSLSKNLGKLYREIHRILKPGGRLACLDWVRLDNYDAKNSEHVEIMRRVKPLIGAIGTPSIEEYVGPMRDAGFKVMINENASIDGLQAPLIEKADKFFTRAYNAVKFLVACKVLPKHFRTLFDRFTQDGEAFIEGDRMRLHTSSHYVVAEKQ